MRHRISRRDLLFRLGPGAALAAAARSGYAQVSASSPALARTATTCILVNLNGAPSHVDTFDIKPGVWTPGDLNLQAGAGGIVLSQTLFPKLSALTGDLCIIRSMQSWEAAHERGQFYLQTGHSSNPAFAAETPHIGAVTALELGGDGKLPGFMTLNGGALQGPAFLGGRVEALAPPLDPRGFLTLEHNFYAPPTQDRFEQKYRLLQQMDSEVRTNPFDSTVADYSAYYDTAKSLMYDPSIAHVFQMADEDRGRFGDSYFGRSCIVARNAVQAHNGVHFIHLFQDGWDTHQSMFDRGYGVSMYSLCNELDRGIGTLIEDLKASGDLGRTMIVIVGEFGRTPGPLNGRGGRDHYRDAMFCVMAGGGAAGGRVIGATDKLGATLVDPGWSKGRAVYFEDITSTMYSALGIDYTKSITDTPSGRRYSYVAPDRVPDFGPVAEVFG